ncbi:hypothetical protein Tco_0803882 [Tanacetum coccineum]|uniref:Uncharacterized protein n=1 Tax=Tanacetum coccineum TaxID=301880 RepID=A0ABQ5A2V3_9ASTR
MILLECVRYQSERDESERDGRSDLRWMVKVCEKESCRRCVKRDQVLGTCGELDPFVSIPDEGDMAFLRKKVKSGAAVGKLVLLQVIKAKDLKLGTRRKLRLRMNFAKTLDFHSSKNNVLIFC